MDAIECLVTRRSIRNYTKEPVSAGDIENVVEIAQMVSCWENTQPVRYVAVLDNDLKNRRSFPGIRKTSTRRLRSSCFAQ